MDLTPENLQHIVYHIFLPPKLPQKASGEDVQRQINLQLVQLVEESVGDYKKFVPSAQEEWNRISRMLSHLGQMVDTPPGADQLRRALLGMATGGQ